jgi:hypothetical protein
MIPANCRRTPRSIRFSICRRRATFVAGRTSPELLRVTSSDPAQLGFKAKVLIHQRAGLVLSDIRIGIRVFQHQLDQAVAEFFEGASILVVHRPGCLALGRGEFQRIRDTSDFRSTA